MNKTSKQSSRPSHALWHVQGEGEKARWTRIGAAWLHKDKTGANLAFDLVPLSGRVVMREITDRDNDQTGADAQGGE